MRLPPRYRSADFIALCAAASLALVVMLPALGAVPIWDGAAYTGCVLNAAYDLNINAIACAEHPTHMYIAALVPAQFLEPGSSLMLHLGNLALHLLALWGFNRVLHALIEGERHARLRLLILLAAAVQPAVLGSLLNPNPDTGVYAFTVMLLGATLGAPRTDRALPAFVVGLGLCFSKEPGIAIALVVAAGVLFAAPRWRTARGELALFAPPALALGWILWARETGAQRPWAASGPGRDFRGFAPFGWDDPTFGAYLIGIFILGFGWLVTSVTLADALMGTSRLARRLGLRAPDGLDARIALTIAAIALVVTLGLTSYHTFHHVRYFLVLYPLWLLAGVAALVRLGLPTRLREGIALTWLGAHLLASWTSLDPVSRAVYGTFDTGGSRMYEMTSYTGECCGRGQDQLVYNLQYTGFSLAQDALFRELKPSLATVIAGPGPVNWQQFTQLETGTFERTVRRTDAFMPVFTDHFTVIGNRHRIPEFWFVDMPNSDNARFLGQVAAHYDEVSTVVAAAHGVTITARRFVRRGLATP